MPKDPIGLFIFNVKLVENFLLATLSATFDKIISNFGRKFLLSPHFSSAAFETFGRTFFHLTTVKSLKIVPTLNKDF
jgi:hypothetical protein